MAHFIELLGVCLDVGDAMDGHTLVSLALLDGFFLLTLCDAVHSCPDLGLSIEWIHEEAFLQVEQIVDEGRLEHLAFGMAELAITVHHAHLPVSEVRVTQLLLSIIRASGELFRPNELTIAVELAEMQVAAILGAVGVHEVTVAVASPVVPLARILGNLVGLDLNAAAMAHGEKLWHKLFVNLRDIFDN